MADCTKLLVRVYGKHHPALWRELATEGQRSARVRGLAGIALAARLAGIVPQVVATPAARNELIRTYVTVDPQEFPWLARELAKSDQPAQLLRDLATEGLAFESGGMVDQIFDRLSEGLVVPPGTESNTGEALPAPDASTSPGKAPVLRNSPASLIGQEAQAANQDRDDEEEKDRERRLSLMGSVTF